MFDLSYSFLMPPTVLIVVCLAAAFFALLRPRIGIAVMVGGSVLLYLSSLPFLSILLTRQIEEQIPAGPDPHVPQAIVVLGGDMLTGDGAGVPDTLGPMTLQRLVYAARLYRIVHLPVAVSGGRFHNSAATLAGLMAQSLEHDFAVSVAWSEDKSETTFENAEYSAQLLKPANVSSVFVVTQAWHIPRALWSFERVGMHAVPWPTPRLAGRPPELGDFLPSAGAFAQTFLALHEILGLAYYRLRY